LSLSNYEDEGTRYPETVVPAISAGEEAVVSFVSVTLTARRPVISEHVWQHSASKSRAVVLPEV